MQHQPITVGKTCQAEDLDRHRAFHKSMKKRAKSAPFTMWKEEDISVLPATATEERLGADNSYEGLICKRRVHALLKMI